MSKDKHSSAQTSGSSTSGGGGKHTREQDRPVGWPLGSRTDRPHNPDGWGSGR